MAAKETLRAIKEVSLVTMAGATEGAVIGTFFGVGGPTLVGGLIGGATAFSGEIIGRRLPKQTVTVHGKDTIHFSVTPQNASSVVAETDASLGETGAVSEGAATESPIAPESLFTSQATETRNNVPLIQVPDTIRELRKIVLARTSGKLQGERTEAAIVDNARAMNLVYLPHQQGAIRAI